MRKKRILYNELSDEIYESSFWTKTKLIFIGVCILFLAFILNFSIEDKINWYLTNALGSNQACPMQFEKTELHYFPPKINIQRLTILGNCFGQPTNQLYINEIKITPDFPSIAHIGIRIGLEINAQDTHIKLYPVVSPFSTYIEIDNSYINAKMLHPFFADDKSPIAGKILLQGFLKLEDGNLADANIKMQSNNFHFPSQRISGFDLPLIPLEKLQLEALFERPGELKIKNIIIGKPGKQIEINLKGKLAISKSSFASSMLMLDGTMTLSPAFMTNFSFVTLMLPAGHTDGKYMVRINGPIINPGAPQFQ